MVLRIEDIKIGRRVRRDLGDIDALKDSMKRYGLLNPVTVTRDNRLVAGRRRLEAAAQLGWRTIEAAVVDPADDAARLEMELEENTQRAPFTDEDLLKGYERLQRVRNPSALRRLWNLLRRLAARLFRAKRR